jgi:crossover junction endodeoxyribonuclease RusA
MRGGRKFLSPKAKAFRADVIDEVLLQSVPGERFDGSERLRMHVALFPPDRRIRDIDNVQKSLWDALTHAEVYADDSQIDAVTIERMGIERGGRVIVTIERMH